MHSDKLPTGQTPEEIEGSSTHVGEPADVASDTVLKSPYGETTAVVRTSILSAAHSAPTAPTPPEAPIPSELETAQAAQTAPIEATPEDDVAAADAVVVQTHVDEQPAEGSDASDLHVLTEIGSAAAISEKRPRRRRWVLSGVAAVLLLVGVGGYAYAEHYADVAVPGTTVAGTDVSGMSRDEIINAITARAQDATVTITGDAQATASLSELGTTVDAAATADAAMKRGAGIVDRFKALLSTDAVDVVTSSEDAVLQAYAAGLVPNDQSKAKNASVTLNADSTSFEITASREGLSIDVSELADAAATAARSLGPTAIDVTYKNVLPAVSDDDARTVANTANTWISQDVSLTSEDGTESYTADTATKASWVTVTDNLDTAPTLAIDTEKVAQWVDAQANTANVAPVTGKRNVNSSGRVVAISVEAVAGQTVNNTNTITEAITDALTSSKAYSGTFKMDTSKEEWEERRIADGAENLAYQAADGEKWIDIDLSNKTVTAYEGATVVRGPVLVVDGAAETPTVTGTYHVYLQYETQTMRGQNADGTDYETENVPWISYFYAGYALHGAPWRSSWGYSGSHGCLNMPVGEAKWFYDWSEIGTTVTSHY